MRIEGRKSADLGWGWGSGAARCQELGQVLERGLGRLTRDIWQEREGNIEEKCSEATESILGMGERQQGRYRKAVGQNRTAKYHRGLEEVASPGA